MTFIVFVSLVRIAWPPCHIKSDTRKFLEVLAGRTKCSGGPHAPRGPNFAHPALDIAVTAGTAINARAD